MRKIRCLLMTGLWAFGVSSCVFSCSSEEKKEANAGTKDSLVQTTSSSPFGFYKQIEVKPGFYFEVVSWGRGVDTLGGFLILMSDSLKNTYRSVAAERNGLLRDAWNMDMDNDGNPEIYVQYVVRGNVNDLHVYEYSPLGFDKISFPGLSAEMKKKSRGNDEFYMKEGSLYRKVALLPADSLDKTPPVKTLRYRLEGKRFAVEEIK